MKHVLPPLTQNQIEAFAASAVHWLGWLLLVVAKLGAPRKSRLLHRLMQDLERAVESILFLKAVHRFGPPPQGRRIPRSAPPGFRRQRNARMRLFFRNAHIRARKAVFAQRIASLMAALADPESHIRYFFKRLLRGLRGARLFAVRPPAIALAADAPHSTAACDTS